ncbi:MAG: hypothetical protein NZ853_07315 [Leptospiraceae bacterium]|nr:hypothetical protein [Leptospiraceae bacterium]MDW7975757.1 hypothetical protein [Leptospiraceae bacterium]
MSINGMISYSFARELSEIRTIKDYIHKIYMGKVFSYDGKIPNNIIGVLILELDNFVKKVILFLREVFEVGKFLENITTSSLQISQNLHNSSDEIKEEIAQINVIIKSSKDHLEENYKNIINRIFYTTQFISVLKSLSREIDTMNQTISKLSTLYHDYRNEIFHEKNSFII